MIFWQSVKLGLMIQFVTVKYVLQVLLLLEMTAIEEEEVLLSLSQVVCVTVSVTLVVNHYGLSSFQGVLKDPCNCVVLIDHLLPMQFFKTI